MAWKKVKRYHFGFDPSKKKYWMNYTLEGTSVSTQMVLTAGQVLVVEKLFSSSTTIHYQTTSKWFMFGVRTL